MRKNAWPTVNLAPQVLINCHGGGSCDGGDPGGVYEYVHQVKTRKEEGKKKLSVQTSFSRRVET